KPDDAAKVAELEKRGAGLKKDKDGFVTSIDLSIAQGKSEADLDLLAGTPNVEELDLSVPEFTDAGIDKLNGLKLLKKLNLSTSGVGDAGLAKLTDLPALEEINLQKANVRDDGLATIAKWPKIKRIRMAQTNVTDKGLESLKAAKQIELLDLSDCTGISNEGITQPVGLSTLRSLRVSGAKITDEQLAVAA